MNSDINKTWVWIDLDDTIWDFKNNSILTLRQLYAEEADIRNHFPSEDYWVESYSECNRNLWKLYNQAFISKEFLKIERFRKPFADAGCDAPLDKLIAKHLDIKYLDILGSMKTLVPGARQLLHHLKNRGYHIGIISNGFHEVQHAKIKSSGIDHMIDIIILSDDVGVNKPNPRIFEYAMQCAHTDSSHCIMIGDNPDTDINGALRVGWRAIYFDREAMEGTCPDTGVVTVTSLNQITNLL